MRTLRFTPLLRSNVDLTAVASMRPSVSCASFAPASGIDVANGLLGWASITFGSGLCVHGVAVRRTRSGRFVLSFPVREDRRGRRRPTVVLDEALRIEVERRVIDQLIGEGRLAS